MDAAPLRRLARCTVLATAATALLAGGCASKRPFDAHRPPRPVPLEGAVVEVPAIASRGVLLVPTVVDGKGPFWFFLDTGSTTTVISEEVADIVGLRVEDRTGSVVTEAGRRDGTIVQATLRELKVGKASFRSVGALVEDLSSMSKGIGRPIDGILGVPVLSDHLWTLDAQREAVRIEEGALPPADGADVLDLRMEGGLPMVRVDVAGREIDAILDSGQGMALSIGPDDLEPFRKDLRIIGESIGQVLDGPVRRDVARLDGDVRIGTGITLRAPAVLLGRATRVGMAAFEGRVVTFDLGNRRFRATAE